MQTKTCTKCGTEKPVTEFHKDKTGKYGVTSRCKVCVCAYVREYERRPEVRERNREHLRRPEVRERYREYQRKYRQRPEIKEHDREYRREYRQRPEVKEYRREYDRQSWELGLKRSSHREIVSKYATRKVEPWSDAEIKFLMSSDLPLIDIALELGRTYSAVHLKRTRLRKQFSANTPS